jgi:hypothetical protein
LLRCRSIFRGPQAYIRSGVEKYAKVVKTIGLRID